MKYRIVTKDYGQGTGVTAFPVSTNTGLCKADSSRPYAAYEVLTRFFGEDLNLVIGNYIKMEPEQLHRAGIMKGAGNVRLVSCNRVRTESRLKQPISATVVDFIANCRLAGDRADHTTVYMSADFRIRYILDLRPCEQQCIGPFINVFGEWDDPIFPKYEFSTNDYLIPILRTEDYETVAREMITDFYSVQEYSQPGFRINGDELACRMGLVVKDVFFDDPLVMGQIYYAAADVQLIDYYGNPYTLSVKPGTILVNERTCRTVAARNSTIAHECSHMYLDRWFFMLQLMTGSPYAAYTSRRKVRPVAIKRNNAIDWMELQCEKLPAYLLMEKESTIAFIEAELDKYRAQMLERCVGCTAGKNINPAMEQEADLSTEIYRRVINSLSEHYQVSNAMAKYRMIELGYFAAEGINCYLDGMSIPDHGCYGKWPEGVTFSISAKDAVALMDQSPFFREQVLSGKYRYVEAHFCLNDARYLEKDSRGWINLTPYARSHINECCLAFTVGGRYKTSVFRYGATARSKTQEVTDKYLTRYDLSAAPEDKEIYAEQNRAFAEDSFLWGELAYSLPDGFGPAVDMFT